MQSQAKMATQTIDYGLAIPFLAMYLKEGKAGGYMPGGIALTVAKHQRQTKCSWADGWRNKVVVSLKWNIIKIKSNEVLTCATVWMNFENVMPGDRSQI